MQYLPDPGLFEGESDPPGPDRGSYGYSFFPMQ